MRHARDDDDGHSAVLFDLAIELGADTVGDEAVGEGGGEGGGGAETGAENGSQDPGPSAKRCKGSATEGERLRTRRASITQCILRHHAATTPTTASALTSASSAASALVSVDLDVAEAPLPDLLGNVPL